MRGRLLAARLLVVLFAVLAAVSLLAGYVRYQALDNETFRQTAEELIADDDVRNQIATTLVETLYENVDVAALLEEQLPPDQQRLAGLVAAGVRELSDRAAQQLLERPRAQELWVASLARTHQQLLNVLNDDLTAIRTQRGVVTLDLRPLVERLGERTAVLANVAARLPEGTGQIELMRSDELETAQNVTNLLQTVGPFLPILTLLVGALAIWLAAGRRRAILRALAVALVVVGLVVLVVRGLAGSYIVDNLVATESVRPAVEDAWSILTDLLADGAWTVIGLGVVALVGVWLSGGSRSGVAVRREVAPVLARPELAFGGAAVLLLLVIWWGPTAQTRRWDFVLLTAILLGLGVEALRRQVLREYPDAATRSLRVPGRLPSLRREAGGTRVADLERLAQLRERGAISDDEFAAEKLRLLGAA